jgi:hypothetical protein
MTAEHRAFVESFVTAERAGDAATALEYHRGLPMFARSTHRQLLTQLADLSGEMTPWLWARWAAYQCTRADELGTRSGAAHHGALVLTLEMFHDETMQQLYDEGADPMPFIAETTGEDWAFHQICTFETGGLEAFLDDLATGDLAERSTLARQWIDAEMGGYRIEAAEPPALTVRDLATGQPLTVLDLGASLVSGGDGSVIGRLVPSGTEPALMFDTRPLAVDEQLARAVADESGSRGGWMIALEDAGLACRWDPSLLRDEDRELVSDVPGLSLLAAGTEDAAMARTMESLRDGRDEVGRAAFRILCSAAAGTFGPDDRAPYVAAAVLNPHAWQEWRRKRNTPSGEWERWAALVPEPARGRLRRLARSAAAA